MSAGAVRMAAGLALLLAWGCGEDSADALSTGGGSTTTGVAGDGGHACEGVTRSCADVEASFSASSNVVVDCTDGESTFTFSSSGVPSYDSDQSTPNEVKIQAWTVTIPLTATCADTATSVLDSRGEIAFTVAGIPIYGPQDATGGDAIINEGPSMDGCWGHADNNCRYHHHSESPCVFGENTDLDTQQEADGHPPLVAYALDGFAIYAVDSDDSEGESLDGCNGHTDSLRGYHYHMTTDFPYTIGCYAGAATGSSIATAEDNGCETAGAPGGPPPGQ